MGVAGVIYRRIPLTAGGEAVDPWTLLPPPGAWRPLEDLVAALDAAAGEALVVLVGRDPHACPHLEALAAEAAARGLKLALQGAATELDATAADRLGVEVLIVPLHGDALVHDARCGDGSHAAALALIAAPRKARVRVRTVLSDAAPGAVSLCARGVDRLTLVGLDAVDPTWLDAAWQAARGAPFDLDLEGVDLPWEGSRGALRPLDDHLLALRRRGGWLPGLAAGVSAPDASPDTVAEAHALGLPVRDARVDLPAYPPAGGEVVIVVPHVGDALLAQSTLPGLADGLRAAGVPVRLLSVWSRPWNLYAPDALMDPGAGLADRLGDGVDDRQGAAARKLEAAFLARLDLDGAARVIVPDWRAALAVWRHPSLPRDATVEVLDVHMLHDVDVLRQALGAGRTDGGWWPDERLFVTSCFPAYVAAYAHLGIPVGALRWRPYPVCRAHLPDVPAGGDWLAAGNQRRDGALLEALGARLDPAGPALDVLSATTVTEVGALRWRGTTTVAGLAEAIARARAVVLPVRPHAFHAAGITVAALARAAGRPMVGTRAWGLVDHLMDGRDAWLVEGQPAAFAEALPRADALTPDPRAVDTAAWVQALRDGAPTTWPER